MTGKDKDGRLLWIGESELNYALFSSVADKRRAHPYVHICICVCVWLRERERDSERERESERARERESKRERERERERERARIYPPTSRSNLRRVKQAGEAGG